MRHPIPVPAYALMLLPALLGLGVLLLLPLLGTLLLSLFEYNALAAPEFIGLMHFRRLAGDELFRQAAWNSVVIAALAVPLRLTLAFTIALAFDRMRHGRIPALLLICLPILLPAMVWVLIWLWLLNPHFGPASMALDSWQKGQSAWLLSVWGARWSIVATTSLLVGEMVLVLIAVRRQIPRACYEVCAVEAVPAFTTFFRVTLPWLLPALLILAARDVALSFELAMLPSQLITKGGPLFQSYLLPSYVYESAFEHLRFGYAAAMSGLVVLVTLSMISIQYLALGHWLRQR